MKILVFLSLIFFSAHSTAKRSHKAHTHGEGKFVLAAEGKSLEIEMEIPANDIVGFEHMPKTKAQKNAVKKAVKTLNRASEIVVLPSEAGCKVKKANVESPLAKSGHHHHHHHDDDSHAEFHISYKFQCEKLGALSSAELKIFQFFPSLKELHGQAVTTEGQFSHELTPNSSVFKLSQ